MSDDVTVYVARKTPHTNGGEKGVFDTLDEATDFLDRLIKEEPAITEYNFVKNTLVSPDYTYEVVEGKGKVAGHITEIPYYGDTNE
jgi:hypothetical protein